MINELKYKVGKESDGYVNKLVWGYNTCSVVDAKSIRPYSELLDRELVRKRYGGECICPEIRQTLNEKVNLLLQKSKIDSLEFKDTSGYNFWAYTNSDCIIPTHYQKWCYQCLCDLSVSISFYNKEKDCDLSTLTFISKEEVCELTIPSIKSALAKVCKLDVTTTIDTHGCDLGAQVFLAQNYCSLEDDFKITNETCEIAHCSYIEKHGCDISLNAFKHATSNFHNC